MALASALGFAAKYAGDFAWEKKKEIAKYACSSGLGDTKYGKVACNLGSDWMNESTSLPPVNTVSKKRKSTQVDEFEPPKATKAKKKKAKRERSPSPERKKKKKKLKNLRS